MSTPLREPRAWHSIVSRTALFWLARIAALGLLAVIMMTVDLGAARETLSRASTRWVILSALLASVSMVVRGWRWSVVARATGLHYDRLMDYLLPFYAGAFLGIVLPQTAASFTPVAYMSADGHPWRRSAASIVLDRLAEGLVTTAVAVVAAIYLAGTFPELAVAVLAAVGLTAMGTLLATMALRLPATVPCAPVLRRLRHRASTYLSSALAGTDVGLLMATLSVASLMIVALESAFIVVAAKALGLETGVLFMAASWSMVALVQSLPVSLLGLGPREGFLVLLFDAAGHPHADAVALGLLIFALALVIRLPGALVLLYRPAARRLPAAIRERDD